MSNHDAPSSMENMAMALYVHAAELIKAGKSRKEIKKQLMAQGITADTAETILTRLAESQVNVARKAGYRNALAGAFIIVMSVLLLTGVITLSSGLLGSIVTVGLLLAGIYFAGRGVLQINGW